MRPGAKDIVVLLFAIALFLVGAGCGGSGRAAPMDSGSGGDADTGNDATLADAGDASTGPSPFTIDALVKARIGSENSSGWPSVGTASADIDWKQGPFAAVTLVVDLDTTCYPFETWSTNAPPSGQNVPADCDAFDRNFNAFIDGPDGAGGASRVPFEVMHAITPFGGPEHLEIDLTDFANALPGKHRLRVDLTSFSDAAGQSTGSNNGWTVSARVEVAPGAAPRRVLAAIPLYAGEIKMGDAWPVVSFDAPDGTVGSRLEYRTSGHGQGAMATSCIGPAEEFCDRHQTIFVDGAPALDIHPWRYDCASLCTLQHHDAFGPFVNGLDYCRENPLGLPSSVRASRANWCPGSMTAPFSWPDIPALSVPGPHTFSFQVSEIVSGGTWMVSAIYYAYGS
ncbi:MAG TPA: peptide-N-glycosidase F-related protein [Polyangia bacterium]|nr:peptide-N-glycosidase F-related protein [Polyangia bacterium]